ncbi:type II secretion system minor pseudopilin GspI [Hyphomonas sp.]|uniref:type II secretion system minor pseudopilin GspI n=1 Tax=Hyphomonas sp. TaxID=87 RepID=UPI00391D81D9
MTSPGFSLLETMVALAVFSLAAVGLLSLNTQSARISTELETRQLAQIVAANIATDAVTGKLRGTSPTLRGEQTQLRRTFTWTRTVEAAPGDNLYSIRIDVTEAGSPAVLARLSLLANDMTVP